MSNNPSLLLLVKGQSIKMKSNNHRITELCLTAVTTWVKLNLLMLSPRNFLSHETTVVLPVAELFLQ